jgi:hypothetical protein
MARHEQDRISETTAIPAASMKTETGEDSHR